MSNVTLLTGPPGIGKSTALRKIAESFKLDAITAIVSSEIREDGKRQGFQMEVLGTGQRGLLASPNVESDVRFGTLLPDGRRRLGVTFDFLDGTACPELRRGISRKSLLLVDEIGPMQASSALFRSIIEEVFEKRYPLVASIAQSDDPWISNVRDQSGAALLVLDRWNRDLITEALVTYLPLRYSGVTRNDDAVPQKGESLGA